MSMQMGKVSSKSETKDATAAGWARIDKFERSKKDRRITQRPPLSKLETKEDGGKA